MANEQQLAAAKPWETFSKKPWETYQAPAKKEVKTAAKVAAPTLAPQLSNEPASEGSLLNVIASAGTLNWGDEAMAKALSKYGVMVGDIPEENESEAYDTIRSMMNAERKQYEEANPNKALAAEIGTAMVVGLPRIIQSFANQGWKSAATIAGLEGLLYGSGDSEGGVGIQKGEEVLGYESPVEVPQRLIDGLKMAGISIPTGLVGARLAKFVEGALKDKALVNRLVKQGSLDTRTAAKVLKNPEAIEGEFIPGGAYTETGELIQEGVEETVERIPQRPETVVEAVKELNPLTNQVVTNQAAKEAVRQKVPEFMLTTIREANPVTRKKMEAMSKLRRAGLTNPKIARETPAYNVIGDSFMKRLEKVAQKQSEASERIGKAVKDFEGVRVDYPEAVENFQNGLESLNIKITQDGKLDLSGVNKSSPLHEGAVKKQLQNAVDDLVNIKDGADLHKLKKDIDKRVSYDTSTLGGSDSDADRLLKQLRRDINESLGKANSEYKEANAIFSQNAEAFDNLGSAFSKTKKFDFSDKKDLGLALSYYGQQLRKLQSNYNNKEFISESVKEFDNLAKSYGGKFDDDIGMLVDFEAGMTDRWGDPMKNAFQSKVEAGVKRGAPVDSKSFFKSATGVMRDTYDLMRDKSRHISDEDAWEALQSYINDRGVK